MLTETLSGKCPCCNYDKLFQRYGSSGYLQLDGCANCGFGYASNQHDDDVFGIEAWIDYGSHVLATHRASIEVPYPKILDERMQEKGIISCDTDEDYKEYSKKFEDSLNKFRAEQSQLDKTELRKLIFNWCEKQKRIDDVDKTIFQYTVGDVAKHMESKPVVFKKISD